MKTTIKSFLNAFIVIAIMSMGTEAIAAAKTKVVSIKTSAVCGSCKARIEKALASVDGVEAAVLNLNNQKVKVSSLVVKFEASYFKKATGRTRFVCNDGDALRETIQRAIATNEPQTFASTSIGSNAEGEKVAECIITWSFKAKTS